MKLILHFLEKKNQMNRKPNNIVRIPCKSLKSFFIYWFTFLKPFHNLSAREIDVIASFVKQRYELSKVIKDEELLNNVIMSSDIKKKIREECNITSQNFQVIMSGLRKRKVIINDRINPRYIPNLGEDPSSFQLLLHFEQE